jgi:hypothetical protein
MGSFVDEALPQAQTGDSGIWAGMMLLRQLGHGARTASKGRTQVSRNSSR